MNIFVDKSYRTGLGTGFYDRLKELDLLDRLTRDYRIIVVYGPRNAGKSELVRYWIKKRAEGRAIALQADLMGTRSAIGDIMDWLVAPNEALKRELARVLQDLAPAHINIVSLFHALYMVLRRYLEETVLFIDEYHMLPGYREASYRAVLGDLEALAHYIAKKRPQLKLVVTVSEGFMATSEALARLHGYATSFTAVEPLGTSHFHALYQEYAEKRGCRIGFNLAYRVIGGSPGYLPELCRGSKMVIELVETSKTVLENALTEVRRRLQVEHDEKTDPYQVIELAYTTLSGTPINPLQQPLEHTVGQILALHNIAYPIYGGTHIVYRPQLPIYYHLLRDAVEDRIPTILQVNVDRLLHRLEETL